MRPPARSWRPSAVHFCHKFGCKIAGCRGVEAMEEIRVAAGDSYLRRVAGAFDRWRLAAVALVTVLLSAEALSSSEILGFFSPVEVALAWAEHFLELAVLAAVLTIAYTLVEFQCRKSIANRRAVVNSSPL